MTIPEIENIDEEEVDLAIIINTSGYKAGDFKKSENYISYKNINPDDDQIADTYD